MELSIIIPAYNEEKYIGVTLEHIVAALSGLNRISEIVVVDNESTDKTAEIARQFGGSVIRETVHVISRVRNAGAEASNGDVLIFVDADTRVSPELFAKIVDVMGDEKCFGGAVSVEFEECRRWWIKYYLLGWKFWEFFFNTKQGAAQFCRRKVFDAVNGYDEKVFVGEDVEFYWRLSKYARKNGGNLSFITEPKVRTSSRRFDKMKAWRIVLVTNPIFVRLNWRRAGWKDWYENTIR